MKRAEIESDGKIEICPVYGLRVWNGDGDLLIMIRDQATLLRMARKMLTACEEKQAGLWDK